MRTYATAALIVIFGLAVLPATQAHGGDLGEGFVFTDKIAGPPPHGTLVGAWPAAEKKAVTARFGKLRARAPELFQRAAQWGTVHVYRGLMDPRAGPGREVFVWNDRPVPTIVLNPRAFGKDAAANDARIDWDLVRALAGCAEPLRRPARTVTWHALSEYWATGPRGLKAADPGEALTEHVAALVLDGSSLMSKGYALHQAVGEYLRIHYLAEAEPVPEADSLALQGFLALTRLGQVDAAHKAADQALSKEPKHVDAHMLKGATFMALRAWAKARDAFTQAVEAAADTDYVKSSVLVMRGRTRALTGDAAGGIEDFEHAVRLLPANAEAYYYFAILHRGGGRGGEAVAALDKAIEHSAGNPGFQAAAYRLRAEVKRVLKKDIDGALADLAESLRLNPSDPQANLDMASIHIERKGWMQAHMSLRNVLQSDPKNLKALTLQAQAFRGVGNAKKALEGLEKAVQAHPKDNALRIEQGRCKDDLGDFAGAVEAYTRVVKSGRAFKSDVFLRRGIAYEKLGRHAEAIADLEKVARIPKLAKLAAPHLARAQEAEDKAAAQRKRLEGLAPDEGLLLLDTLAGARVWIDRKERGTEREFKFSGLSPGKRHPKSLTVRFADGGKAQRTYFVAARTVTRLAVKAPSRIVVHEEDRIRILDPEGGNRREIGGKGRLWNYLSISPDGRRLLAVRHARPGRQEEATLVMARTEGGSVREFGQGTAPAWSPDGRRIAFQRTRPSPPKKKGAKPQSNPSDIYVLAPKGGPRRLARGYRPRWSPDGTLIAFGQDPDKEGVPTGAFVVRPDGSGLRRLADGTDPVWSPDGSRLVVFQRKFPGMKDYRENAYVVGLDKGVRHLVGVVDNWFSAVWSPDGALLACVDTPPGRKYMEGDLYLVKLDGSGRIALGRGSDPQWSPDGRNLAFVRGLKVPSTMPHAELAELYVASRDGSTIRRVTRTGRRPRDLYTVGVEAFCWSPLGARLAFVQVDAIFDLLILEAAEGRREVYSVSMTGGTPTLLVPHGSAKDEVMSLNADVLWR